MDLSLTTATFSNGITQGLSVRSEDRSEINWDAIQYQLAAQTLTVSKNFEFADQWSKVKKIMPWFILFRLIFKRSFLHT